MARDYADLIEGTLVSQLATGTTSSVQVQLKKVNGSYPTFPTGQTEIRLKRVTEDGIYFERCIVAAGSSTNATTGVATLGALTRNCSLSDGTDTTGTSATITWPASTQVYIPWGVGDAELTPKLNEVNTFTAGSALRSTSTTSPLIRLNNVTTAQRTAMTAANGDMVYDTDLSQAYQYIGGAWTAIGNTGTAAATTTSLGTAEKGTTADIRAETATGDGGGPIFIPADATAVLKDDRIVLKDATELTISSGAITVTQPYHSVDTESDTASDDLDTINAAVGVGEIIVLVANNTGRTVVVKHNTGNIKLSDGLDFSLDDTEKSITLLKQSGNWIEIARGRGLLSTTCKTVYVSGASSTTLTNPTSVTAFDTHTYTIPASDLVAGVAYEFEIAGTLVRAAGNATAHVMLGSTDISNAEIQFGAASGRFYVNGTVYGTTTAGASVAVRCSFIAGGSNVAAVAEGDYISTSAIATNGTLALQFGFRFSSSDAGNSATLQTCKIKKLSATSFI